MTHSAEIPFGFATNFQYHALLVSRPTTAPDTAKKFVLYSTCRRQHRDLASVELNPEGAG